MDFSFKNFIEQPRQYTEFEIANLYFGNPNTKVREIAEKTGKSVAEVYRILHKYGKPNRVVTNHHNVLALAENPSFKVSTIAQMTGYTPRNVRYILSKKATDEHKFD